MDKSTLSYDAKQQPDDNIWILHPEQNVLLITEDRLLTISCPGADLCQQVMGHGPAGEDHPVLIRGGPDGQDGIRMRGRVFAEGDCASLNKRDACVRGICQVTPVIDTIIIL